MSQLISIVLLLHMAICGRALLALLRVRLGQTRTWLLAPAMGFAALVLLVTALNQAGLPVGRFALPLAALATAGAVAGLWRSRAGLPASLMAVGAVLLLALVGDSWPAWIHGLNWVGYGNDDMTNYCLGAQRFLTHGFYDIPTHEELAGQDYSQYFWMLHVAGLIRFGSEEWLAYVSGATGLSPVQIFMPAIIALALMQLSAVMALAGRTSKFWLVGLVLALMPLWHCGTMYQLIAQVAGLGLLAALFVLTARERLPRSGWARLRLATVAGLLAAALGVTYPELLPFFGLGWAGWLGLRLIFLRRWPRGLGVVVLLTAGVAFLLIRHNLLSTYFTLAGQMQDGLNSGHTLRGSLFPYFLMPAGPAFYLGSDVIVSRYTGLWSTVAVAMGFVALVFVGVCWTVRLRHRSINTIVFGVMGAVAVKLFLAENGFGLFKLTMFTLPFLAILLAEVWQALRFRWLAVGLVLLIAPIWLIGSWKYVGAATPRSHSVVGELFNASESIGSLPEGKQPAWVAATSSPVIKLLALSAPATRLEFISQLIAATIMGRAAAPYPDWVWRCLPGAATPETARDLVRYIEEHIYRHEKACGLTFWSRTATEQTGPGQTDVITAISELRAFNKLAAPAFPAGTGLFTHASLDRLQNHLVFVQSDAGQHYYLGRAGRISVYRPEPDLYQPGGYFFAIGRHLLFRVLNPSAEPVRLHLSTTASLLGAGRTSLPVHATVLGDGSVPQPLDLVGAGSANVYSPPLRPVFVHGASYVALDLGREPVPLGLPAHGLNGLYNRNLPLDTRLAIAYCRDISLVTETMYRNRKLQRSLERFPADLVGTDAVEHSGIYEDGWLADRAWVVLGPAAPGDVIELAGEVPVLPPPAGTPHAAQCVQVLVEGQTLSEQTLPPGPFRLCVPVPATTLHTRVELHFGYARALPSPDDRIVSARLYGLSLRPSP